MFEDNAPHKKAWRRREFEIAGFAPISGYGTHVWTDRALQAGFDDLEIIGLAHLYSAL
jgi:hypothetical protein